MSEEARTVLVVGATGGTGSLLVSQLLNRGCQVHVVVRSMKRVSEAVRDHPRLSVHVVNLLELPWESLVDLVRDCQAVASCLGHNLTFRGVFGPPRRLVRDSVRRLCEAIEAAEPIRPVRFVLMNTAGNRNRDLEEPISFAQSLAVGLIRLLVPPHPDNETAADHLRTEIGQTHSYIEWVAVRPDSLIDLNTVTPYTLHTSPTRSAIFDPGKTSRINVAHFMTELMTKDPPWVEWKGRMPVVYNEGF